MSTDNARPAPLRIIASQEFAREFMAEVYSTPKPTDAEKQRAECFLAGALTAAYYLGGGAAWVATQTEGV